MSSEKPSARSSLVILDDPKALPIINTPENSQKEKKKQTKKAEPSPSAPTLPTAELEIQKNTCPPKTRRKASTFSNVPLIGNRKSTRPLRLFFGEEIEEEERAFRLINRTPGKMNILLRGAPFPSLKDSYHSILDLSWWKLLVLFTITFIVVHSLFATLYYFDHSGILDASTWLDCFYFSVQTMETIGYGRLNPESDYTNFIVAIQAWFGVLFTASVTGLVFEKISRPSRIRRKFVFSQFAVINTEQHFYDRSINRYQEGGVPCMIFRMINLRKAQLCSPAFHLLLISKKKKHEYFSTPQLHEVKQSSAPTPIHADSIHGSNPGYDSEFIIHEMDFEVNQMIGRPRDCSMSAPLGGLPWTVVHAINEHSPLYNKTKEDLIEMEAEVIAMLDGVDEACSDNVQARWSYTPSEIIWNAKFEDIVSRNYEDGHFEVDLLKFDSIINIEPEKGLF